MNSNEYIDYVIKNFQDRTDDLLDLLPENWKQFKYRICLNCGFCESYFYVLVDYKWIYCFDLPKYFNVTMDELDEFLENFADDLFNYDYPLSCPCEFMLEADNKGKFNCQIRYHDNIDENESHWGTHKKWEQENGIYNSSLDDDLFYLNHLSSSIIPLIPYLNKDRNSIGYVNVSFENEEQEDKMLIHYISHAYIRDKNGLHQVEYPDKEHFVLNFEKGQLEKYVEKSMEYLKLLDNLRIEEALIIFNEIASPDLKAFFEQIFEK